MSRGTQPPQRPDSEVRTLVERALRGTDRVVAHQSVTWLLAAKMPPKRYRPQARVSAPTDAPRKSFGKRCLDAFLGVVGWVLDPFPWLGDWIFLFKSRKRRLQEKRLKGGWKSIAGGLMSKTCIAVPHVLVVGDRTLSLVYVGQTEAEIAWSVPKEQLTGVQVATWDVPTEQEATLRCHFTDGSWADVKAVGPEWKRFVDLLPKH